MANFTALKTAINNAIKTNGNEEITGAILQAILDAMVETLGDSAITDLENAITTEVTNRENAVGDVAADLAAEALARANKDNLLDNRINAEEYNRQNADAALSQTMSQGFQTLGSQMTALNAAISALNAAYQNGYLYGGIATPSSSPSNNKCFYIALQGGTYTNFGGVGVVEGINIIKNDSGWKVEHIYDQTTLLNEFYLLRQQVIRALASYEPVVIQGDVTNAPDEEDLTSDAQHLLKFKDRAYSPLNFSGLGMKILRKNILPLNDSAAFNGFVEGVTAEETLAGTPELIFWDRMNTRFIGIKDGIYYAAWTDDDNYVPVSTSLVYMYNGTPYQWTGSDFIVDETEVPNLVNCLTQDMINEAYTIYIIRYDYTLAEDITIPANCVLEFDGGSISGEHTITGANTGIQAGLVKIFSTDVTLAGTWNVEEAYPEWFGAKGDGLTNDGSIIQVALNFASIASGRKLQLLSKPYLVNNQIDVPNCVEMSGVYSAADKSLTSNGTVIVTTNAELNSETDGLIRLGNSTKLTNVKFWYPNQTLYSQDNVTAYCPSILVKEDSDYVLIEDVFFGGAYYGIRVEKCKNINIRRCIGTCLYRGIYMYSSRDISRTKDCHFNYNYLWQNTEFRQSYPDLPVYLPKYIWDNGIAYEIRRSDWGMLDSCFCYGYHVGFKIDYPSSGYNLMEMISLLNCGADGCHTCVSTSGYNKILIDGFQATSFCIYDVNVQSEDYAFKIGNSEKVEIVNCNFWGLSRGGIQIMGAPSYIRNAIVCGCSFNWLAIDHFDANAQAIFCYRNVRATIANNIVTDMANGFAIIQNCQCNVIGNIMKNVNNAKTLTIGDWISVDGTSVLNETCNIFYKTAWRVVYALTNITASNLARAANGQSYTTTLTAASGYNLPSSITVKMGNSILSAGTDYTYNSSTGQIVILGTGGSGGVTGNIIVTAVATS